MALSDHGFYSSDTKTVIDSDLEEPSDPTIIRGSLTSSVNTAGKQARSFPDEDTEDQSGRAYAISCPGKAQREGRGRGNTAHGSRSLGIGGSFASAGRNFHFSKGPTRMESWRNQICGSRRCFDQLLLRRGENAPRRHVPLLFPSSILPISTSLMYVVSVYVPLPV